MQCSGGEKQANAKVNVSAGGIGIFSEAQLNVGERLELKLLFLPSYLCICTLGKVVHSTPCKNAGEESHYLTGVDFTHISELSSEALAYRVREKESAIRRREKGKM